MSVAGVIAPFVGSALDVFGFCVRGPVRRGDFVSIPTVLVLRLPGCFVRGGTYVPFDFGAEDEMNGETTC